MLEITLFVSAFALSIAGVAAFRRFGVSRRMLDVPNERSSHTVPTPRGGGVVIVAACLMLYIAAGLVSAAIAINWYFIAGAVLIAAVSWLDDLRDLPAWVRFLAHSLAAAIVIAGVGPIPGIVLPGFVYFEFGAAASYLVTFLWIAWLINAYNFMDGIDGIAGSQAVAAGVAWAAIAAWSGDLGIYLFAGVVVFANLGFLYFNWSPARVFMGDVGSAFLGYAFAAMPLLAQKADDRPLLLAAAITFVWLFLFDTVLTFVRRLFRREKVWTAHRQHLYQRVVVAGGWSHSAASLLYSALTGLVAVAFIAHFILRGIGAALLVFIYTVAAIAVVVLASRKKV